MANMMETLKQIQRDLADQKAYMRNLHKTVNEKLNFMEEQISFTKEKISDLPQVLIAIERLEQQVKKNNMLLFGNDENEKNIEDRALVPYRKDYEDKNTVHLVEPNEKCKEDTEATPIRIFSKESLIEEAEKNSEETKHDDSFRRADQCKDEVSGHITNEIKEVKEMIRELMKVRHTSVEETATCCIHDAARISSTYLNTDQINKLDNKLNDITNIYQSDMIEIKELIKESIAINIKSIEESSKPPLKQETLKVPSISFSSDEISQLNTELKRITDATQSEKREIKELIKNSEATSKPSIQEATELLKQETVLGECNQSAIREIKELIKILAKRIPIELEGSANTVREQKTVEISPTYFSADQLSKLNSELQRITEMYKDTNIYPAIQVVQGAGDEHPVMKQLRTGVFYFEKAAPTMSYHKVKLGYNGLKRSDVIDMITDYPDLIVNDVVKNLMEADKTWDKWYEKYIYQPKIFKDGEFKYLPKQH